MRTAAPLTLAALLLLSASVQAVEVKLQVIETEKVARTPAIITSGVPFARGALKDVGGLALKAGGKPVPAQFGTTVKWDDGSVRWALLDTQVDVPAGGKVELMLSDAGGNPAPAAPIRVDDGAEVVKVSTGPLEFTIGKKKPGLLESLKVDGKEVVTGAGRGLVFFKEGGGEVVAGPPSEVKVEQAGPLRAIVCLRGKFPGVHNELLGYTVRLSAFAGRKHLRAQVWLENHGAMGYYYRPIYDDTKSPNMEWLYFDGLALELGLGLGESPSAKCEGVEGAGSLKVLQICKLSRAQEKERGYKKPPFYTWNDFEYTVTSGGKELKKGERTDGVVEVRGGGATLAAAIRGFWQNYEKAIELEGGKLRFWLWPQEGTWPRSDIRKDVQFTYDNSIFKAQQDGLYNLPGSTRKGHELVLDFSGRDARETSAELSAPLFALAPAGHYAATEAAPGLFAPPEVKTGDADCDFRLASWTRMTRSAADPESPAGIWMGRRYSDFALYWYGWMDFGDLAVPGKGPVSLHHDWLWIMLLGAMRTGDMNFMRLASEMGRHRVEIDQHWSDRDPPQVRGLQRQDHNFGWFHCGRLWRPPGVGTNWTAGVVLYYMLTGEPMALECATRNGEGLRAAWEHIAKTKPYAGPQGDMAATGWGISSFCAMYDLTADKKWLEEALKLFNANVPRLWKAHGPFLHNPNDQIRGQDYQQEDQKYCYAIVPFCELHHRTGDETVMKLLKEGCAKEFPQSFYEAPRFLSDLYAYVGHKTGDRDLVDKGAESFAQAFPSSKCPPVFLPGNSTWSRDAAMMLRVGHLLQYANWKASKKGDSK